VDNLVLLDQKRGPEMAITLVQVTISSTSKEGTYAGRVFKGWETYSINVKGEQITKKRLWTFWLESAADLNKGDVVEFQGELGTKGAQLDKDGKTYLVVEHTLNNPRVKVIHKTLPGIDTLPPLPADEQSPF
jgi:hypothetical protein